MIEAISKDDARLCASVVKEVASAKDLNHDPAAIGKLTTTVARLFNKGLRERDKLLSAAMDEHNAA